METTEPTPLMRRVAFVVLKSLVVLRHRRYSLRLEPGTKAHLVWIDPDPRSRYPYRCAVEGWPEFFQLGRSHEVTYEDVPLEVSEVK